ncbi:unnamed protein product [Parnassius apollo]|uniref:(apollo) hypothetical protein n=1 Tax=Parnassius apollo TaxID=110799 RepID=A0A8S3XR91_PARAO|nr:unnamed protein product [Parnassius apollo]
MEADEDFVGCISCLNKKDLCDLFAVYAKNEETYAQMLKTCFDIKVSYDNKFICSDCAETLEKAAAFKNQTSKNLAMLQSTKDEEYLDESILEEAESVSSEQCNSNKKSTKTQYVASNSEDVGDEDLEIQALDDTICIYCNVQLPTADEISHHIRVVHGLEPKTGMQIRECSLCGASLRNLADHLNRCHNSNLEREERQYACHFCDNVYNSKKACFTHLRMKHGCGEAQGFLLSTLQRES